MQDEKTADCKKMMDLLQYVQTLSDKNLDNLKSFLNDECKEYSKEKRRIYAEHDIDNTRRFNFFESISDKWYMENFHSDILYTILNPKTPEIHRKYFVEKFVKFLGIENRFDCTKDFEVTREEGHIDLLIKNDKQAIIIENKINYAPDMDNQLVRYMKYVDEELGIKTYTVVYLTLINDGKEPPLGKYDKNFKKYADILKDNGVLKKVYAVDGEKSLANNLLPTLCELLQKEQEQSQNEKESCNIARVYINQYKILLEHLGGKAYMKSKDKELIEEIYSSQDKFEAANDFAELWNDKCRINEAVEAVLGDKFRKIFPEKEWEPSTLHDTYTYYWPSNFDDAKVYYFWDDKKGKEVIQQVGFTSLEGKKFSKPQQDKLKNIVQKIENKDGDAWAEKGKWVCCNIKDSPTLLDDLLNALEILFKAK